MVKLKVLEAYTRDVGRGVVRIDYETMDKLNVSTGDPIVIKGKDTTVAKALPLYPSDENKKIIRMDGMTRINCDVAIGDKVDIKKKIKLKPAENVVFVPYEAIPPIDSRYLADALESMVMNEGDKALVPYFGRKLTFSILKVEPSGCAMMTQKTKCTIIDKEEDLEKKIKPIKCPVCGQETKNKKLLWILEMIERATKIDVNNKNMRGEYIDLLDEMYQKAQH